MRIPGFLVVFLLLVVDVSRSQVEIPSSQTAGLPMFRPALIGTGRQALINLIDTAQLIKDGQKDAAIMFSCTVKKNGDVDSASTYRGTPDSNLLQQEVLRQLSAAAQPKFIPAVYNHLPVDAVYYG